MAVARSSRWAASALLRRVASSSSCSARRYGNSAASASSSTLCSSCSLAEETLRHDNLRAPDSLSLIYRSLATAFTQRSHAISPSRSFPSVVGLDSSMFRASSVSCFIVRPYSKRPKKWQGGPHAYIQVESGAPCPPYSPNAGSVKKRKHKKRMGQRHAFAKAQAQQRKEQTKAAVIKRDAARRKRWREGAARARAWAKHLEGQQKQQASLVSA